MESLFFILAAFLWLSAVTLVLIRIYISFRNLTRDVGHGNLLSVLDNVLREEKENKVNIKRVEKSLEMITEEGKLNVKKVGLVRFNPFKELGGDHSFALALLNGKDNGVLITGLHTRERTRVYAKIVNDGKSDLELSNEESMALKIALKR